MHQNPHNMAMYTQTGGAPPHGAPPQAMMHQQPPQMHQGQQQPPTNNQNTQSSMPSPLYPWMRSQFGKSIIVYMILFGNFYEARHLLTIRRSFLLQLKEISNKFLTVLIKIQSE